MKTPSRSPDSESKLGSLARNALLAASVFGGGVLLGSSGKEAMKEVLNAKGAQQPIAAVVPALEVDPALTDAPLWVSPDNEELTDAPLWVSPGQQSPVIVIKTTAKFSQAPGPVLDEQQNGALTFGKPYAMNVGTDAKPDWITFQVDVGGEQVRINGIVYKNQALVGLEVDIKTLKVEKVGQSFTWTGTAWGVTNTSTRSTEDMKALCREARKGVVIAYNLPDGRNAQWVPVK